VSYTVSLIRCPNYEREKVYQAVERALSLIRAEEILKPGYKVFLKINLLSAAPPEKAITTHPEVVGALIRYFRRRKCEVWVGDACSTGDMGGEFASRVDPFKITGIRDVVEREGGVIRNFNTEGYKKLQAENLPLKEIYVAKPILEADIVVSVPKMKTHELTFITGAVKNFFGCIPARERNILHREGDTVKFSKHVLELFRISPCHLSLMDGIVGMEGEGPARGNPKDIGVVLASKNAHALDTIAALIMNFPPQDIPALKTAQEAGEIDFQNIEVLGENLEDCILYDFEKPSTYRSAWKRRMIKILAPLGVPFLNTYPAVKKELCEKCGLCKKRCPVSAITLSPYPVVDYKKCIRCFTCIEICPTAAFYPLRTRFTRLLQKIR